MPNAREPLLKPPITDRSSTIMSSITTSNLVDDPFRSLAGELRRAGGYAKNTTPNANAKSSSAAFPPCSIMRVH